MNLNQLKHLNPTNPKEENLKSEFVCLASGHDGEWQYMKEQRGCLRNSIVSRVEGFRNAHWKPDWQKVPSALVPPRVQGAEYTGPACIKVLTQLHWSTKKKKKKSSATCHCFYCPRKQYIHILTYQIVLTSYKRKQNTPIVSMLKIFFCFIALLEAIAVNTC